MVAGYRVHTRANFGEPITGLTGDEWSLYVCLPDSGRVLSFDLERRVSTLFRKHTGGVRALSLGEEGVFGAQTPSRRIIRYMSDGSATAPCPVLDGRRHNFPVDLIAHPGGSLWFADAIVPVRPPGPQRFPLLENGSILVLENDRDRGWTLRRATNDTHNPISLAFDSTYRSLAVVDRANDEIHIYLYEVTERGDLTHRRHLAAVPTSGDPFSPTVRATPTGNWVVAGAAPDSLLILDGNGTIFDSLVLPDRPIITHWMGRSRLWVGTADGLLLELMPDEGW